MKEKKRKKGKRKGSILLTFAIIASVTFVIFLGIMVLMKVREMKKEPIYQYVSMSEEASARAYVWLNQIEEMSLSYPEIKEIMGDIYLQICLTPTEEKDVFVQTLSDGAYAECKKKAEDGLEKAYREVVKSRFLAEGYDGDITDDMLDNMMQEIYGVSVSEYLAYCDVQLLPTQAELEEQYSGMTDRMEQW